MKLSVITVVFNDVKYIEKTILSVVTQTYKKIEYIVIDGNSTDGTVDIIKKYSQKITYWHSEPDSGLYDAMNKSMEHITGDYVVFLNSGDTFYDINTVNNVFLSDNFGNTDVFYGDTLVIDQKGQIKGKRRHRPPEKLTWRSFKTGMLVSHQAFIPAVRLIEPYDLSYKLSSDFDWCIKIMKKSKKNTNTNLIIAKYLDGGISKQNMVKSLNERFKIMAKNYGLMTTVFVYIRNSIKWTFFAIKHRWT